MTERQARPIRRALISVYDKTGLAELARGLHDAGVDIVSTGSTAKTIAGAGVPVTPVEEVTGFPEVLDGRVKTLHPHVHAGLLADQRKPEHVSALAELGIAAFELVVVNLYPFTETVDSGAGDRRMRRADRHRWPVDGARRRQEPSERRGGRRPIGLRRSAGRGAGRRVHPRRAEEAGVLGIPAYRRVRRRGGIVDGVGAGTRRGPAAPSLPPWVGATWRRESVLRYGENPHQQAALYRNDAVWPGLAQAEQLHGKEMSYNNYTDADAAWRAAFDHDEICVAIIKHANPCGIAISSVSVADAHRKAHECDPLSAFGGVIAANTEVTVEMAETVADIFTEVIIAPAYEPGAVEVLARKKNIRVLLASEPQRGGAEFRQISGGLLLQQRDEFDRARRRPGQLDAGHRIAGRPDDPVRSQVRLADVPRGEVQRDRRRRRRRHRRGGHGSGQPGRRGPTRRAAGR